jgi:hypothetical protein
MSDNNNNNTNKDKTGLADRTKVYSDTLKRTKNPRTATRAYCQGNKWATENAKAVGNW